MFDAYVKRYRELWEEHQGVGALTHQGTEPKIGLIAHMLLAETDEQAVAEATPAWKAYRWNLESPRRLEAEKRGLTQFLGDRMRARPSSVPSREVQRDLYASVAQSEEQERRRMNPGGLSSRVIAGSPASLRDYLDEYVETGANYFICSFQWGDLTPRAGACALSNYSRPRSCRITSEVREFRGVDFAWALAIIGL